MNNSNILTYTYVIAVGSVQTEDSKRKNIIDQLMNKKCTQSDAAVAHNPSFCAYICIHTCVCIGMHMYLHVHYTCMYF